MTRQIKATQSTDRGNPEQMLLERAPCGICKLLNDNELTIQYANLYFFRLFKERVPQPAGQASLAELLPSDEFQRASESIHLNIAKGCSAFDIETLVTTTSKQSTWLLARCRYDAAADTVVCVLFDITTRKQKENELRAQAKKARLSAIDGLTGLLTRSAAIGRINQLFHEQPCKCHALVMVDVDCFKQVNDTMGHACGDKALQMMSAALKESVGAGDIIGRLGGDEFVLCLCGVFSMAALKTQMEQLRESLHIACPHGTTLSGSLGAVVFPRDGGSFKELYPKADAALYTAKAAGKNCSAIYQADTGKSQGIQEKRNAR